MPASYFHTWIICVITNKGISVPRSLIIRDSPQDRQIYTSCNQRRKPRSESKITKPKKKICFAQDLKPQRPTARSFEKKIKLDPGLCKFSRSYIFGSSTRCFIFFLKMYTGHYWSCRFWIQVPPQLIFFPEMTPTFVKHIILDDIWCRL